MEFLVIIITLVICGIIVGSLKLYEYLKDRRFFMNMEKEQIKRQTEYDAMSDEEKFEIDKHMCGNRCAVAESIRCGVKRFVKLYDCIPTDVNIKGVSLMRLYNELGMVPLTLKGEEKPMTLKTPIGDVTINVVEDAEKNMITIINDAEQIIYVTLY